MVGTSLFDAGSGSYHPTPAVEGHRSLGTDPGSDPGTYHQLEPDLVTNRGRRQVVEAVDEILRDLFGLERCPGEENDIERAVGS
jgi:hypothetical protein